MYLLDSHLNRVWKCNKSMSLAQVLYQETKAKERKSKEKTEQKRKKTGDQVCDIFVGCSKQVAQELGGVFAGRDKNNAKVFVRRNQSSCPWVVNSRVRAAGVLPIVEFENQTYIILHQDKSRSEPFLIGGSWDPSEYVKREVSEDLAFEIARRECLEETAGDVLMQGVFRESKWVMFNGLRLDRKECVLASKIQFRREMLTVKDVDDVFYCFVTDLRRRTINNANFLGLMFLASNRQSQPPHYKLVFNNHPETEALVAFPLESKSQSLPFLLAWAYKQRFVGLVEFDKEIYMKDPVVSIECFERKQ